MNEMQKKEAKDLGITEEEFERVLKEKTFHSTNSPVPPGKKSKVLSTHDLDADGKVIRDQRYWDKEKTMKKPAFVTGDVALSESEEGDQKRAEVMAEAKKAKEEKDEKQK